MKSVMARSAIGLGRLSAAALVLLLAAAPARAHCIQVCDGTKVRWPNHDLYFHAGKKSFAGSAVRNALETAKNHWNESPGFFTFHVSYGWGEVDQGNGDNEIWFSTDQGILNGKAGRTETWSNCEEIEETDIFLDANWNYTPSMNKTSSTAYGGSSRTLQTVLTHEMGHALGLCHVNSRYNVMGDESTFVNTNGGTLRAYAGEDAIDGEVDLYGIWPPSTFEDVSVSHWRHGGSDGEYSTHVRTRVFNTSDKVLDTVSPSGEPVFKVSKGQTVKVEFTYENNGRSAHDVDIAYYLSTNDAITTFDTLLAVGHIPNLVRNKPFTTQNTFLNIPNTLQSGKNYYLGAIVNYNKKFAEHTGENNATYIGIRVK